MSELCEICGRPPVGVPLDVWDDAFCLGDGDCYRIAYERTLARADRSEAEFCACKALLMAAQQRAEKAEAGRAAWKDACRKTERERDSNMEAVRGAALREAAELCDETGPGYYPWLAQRIRDLAALPVEPARRQATENTQEAGAPRAPNRGESKDILAAYPNADEVYRKAWAKLCFPELSAEPARDAKEAAPLSNLPPSPTGDAE